MKYTTLEKVFRTPRGLAGQSEISRRLFQATGRKVSRQAVNAWRSKEKVPQWAVDAANQVIKANRGK